VYNTIILMKTLPQFSTYHESLILLGLTSDQALIYEFLLKNGPKTASTIALETHIERTLVYKVMEKLIELNVVIKKDEQGTVALFEAAHPERIQELAEKREGQAKAAKETLSALSEQMKMEYNLAIGKPGVRFFEGLSGVERVVTDTFTTQGEILQYLDMDALDTQFTHESILYTKRRIALHIPKRLLVRDTPFARDNSMVTDTYTHYKLLHTSDVFKALTYIYDNKVAYITLDPNRLIGIIIEDEIIAHMHRVLFNCLWEQGIAPHFAETLQKK